MKNLVLLTLCLAAASATMLPEKMMKKYLYNKVLESCYGRETTRGYHKQWAAAVAKCRGHPEQEHPQLVEVDETDVALETMQEEGLGNTRRRRSYHVLSDEQMEKMQRQLHHRLNNWTCAMRELKLLGEDGAVSEDLIKQHIVSMELPSEHLTSELLRANQLCAQMSSCLPESAFERSPLDVLTGRNIKYMKCFNMGRVEACMREDFRRAHAERLPAADTQHDEAFNLLAVSAAIKELSGGEM